MVGRAGGRARRLAALARQDRRAPRRPERRESAGRHGRAAQGRRRGREEGRRKRKNDRAAVTLHLPLVGRSKKRSFFGWGRNLACSSPPPETSSLRFSVSTSPQGGGALPRLPARDPLVERFDDA